MSYYALLIQHYFCFYYPLPSNVSLCFMSFISQFIEKYLSLIYLCASQLTTCHDTISTHFFHLRPQVATLQNLLMKFKHDSKIGWNIIFHYVYYSCRLILAITIILVWEINNYLTQLSSPRCTLVDSVVKDLKDMVLVYRKEIKINWELGSASVLSTIRSLTSMLLEILSSS
jgi:hypothetical protein